MSQAQQDKFFRLWATWLAMTDYFDSEGYMASDFYGHKPKLLEIWGEVAKAEQYVKEMEGGGSFLADNAHAVDSARKLAPTESKSIMPGRAPRQDRRDYKAEILKTPHGNWDIIMTIYDAWRAEDRQVTHKVLADLLGYSEPHIKRTWGEFKDKTMQDDTQ